MAKKEKDLLEKVRELEDKELAKDLEEKIGDIIVALGGTRPPTGGNG
jgi:hypothetical protein